MLGLYSPQRRLDSSEEIQIMHGLKRTDKIKEVNHFRKQKNKGKKKKQNHHPRVNTLMMQERIRNLGSLRELSMHVALT